MWYSATIVDVYDIAMADIRKYGYKKYPRKVPADLFNNKYSKSKSKSKYQPHDTSKPVNVTSGYSVRIHFDNFSCVWDEWYDQHDFEYGSIAPIYSKSQRKVKILNFHVIQRVLAPLLLDEDDLSDNEEEEEEMTTNTQSKYSVPSIKNSIASSQKRLPKKSSQSSKDSRTAKSALSLNSSTHSNQDNGNGDTSRASEKVGSNAAASASSAQDGSQLTKKTEYRIEILDSPLLIQCESYRSTQHLHNIISEQIVRYYTAGPHQPTTIR
jgi:hypothetical protein